MADNVSITEGSGTPIASDDIGGVQHQRIKITLGPDGVSNGDVSSANPMPTMEQGELVEALEALRFAVNALSRSIGVALPNIAGQPIFEARQATAANLQATATIASGTVTTVSTVSTVTNQAQMGGYAANDQIPALMHMQADNLRRNISVT